MMECNQQKKCYLYYFGELKGSEKRAFKKHLKECEFCQLELNRIKHVWRELDDLSMEQPSFEVKETIKQRAEQLREKKRMLSWMSSWFSFSWLAYRKPLGVAATVAIVVLLVLLSPLKEIIFLDYKNITLTSWDDNFITEVTQIEYALDRVESPDLSTELESFDDEEMFEENDLTSPLMKELQTIQENLQYIDVI
ncbi:MAG: hypothetical protein R6V04_09840 [bacterium]